MLRQERPELEKEALQMWEGPCGAEELLKDGFIAQHLHIVGIIIAAVSTSQGQNYNWGDMQTGITLKW